MWMFKTIFVLYVLKIPSLPFVLFCGCSSLIYDDRVFYAGADDVTGDKVSRCEDE